MQRAIVHFDADAFFASVEQAADRHLRGRPVAVGSLHRGIVASASYEARKFGVYTPMPITRAKRVCPKLIVVPVRFELYEQFSRNIFGMASEVTPLIEKQSVDEGYLDLTGTPSCRKHEPEEVARKLQHDVKDWLKVTVSQGLARNKLLSQIASKRFKPNGLTVIPPDDARELAFLHPLPVKWLPGVGPTCANLLQSAGLVRIGQLAEMPVNWLAELVGSSAGQLNAFARNIDHRPVETDQPEAFSYGHQKTFDEDTVDAVFIEAKLRELLDRSFVRLRADGKQARTVTVKLRYTDMAERQGQMSLAEPTDVETRAYPLVGQLFRRLWDRRVRIRMVQVKLSNVYEGFTQLDLFGVKQKQRNLSAACEAIRSKHGLQAIMRRHDWELNRRETSWDTGLR